MQQRENKSETGKVTRVIPINNVNIFWETCLFRSNNTCHASPVEPKQWKYTTTRIEQCRVSMWASSLQEMWPFYCTANPPPCPSSSFGATASSRDPEHVFDNSPWHSALILCHLTSWHWLGIGRRSQAITPLASHLAPCTQTSGWVGL